MIIRRKGKKIRLLSGKYYSEKIKIRRTSEIFPFFAAQFSNLCGWIFSQPGENGLSSFIASPKLNCQGVFLQKSTNKLTFSQTISYAAFLFVACVCTSDKKKQTKAKISLISAKFKNFSNISIAKVRRRECHCCNLFRLHTKIPSNF